MAGITGSGITGSGATSSSGSDPRSGGARLTRTDGITRRTTPTRRHPSSFRSRRCTSSHRLRHSRTGTTAPVPRPTTRAFSRVLRRGSRSCRALSQLPWICSSGSSLLLPSSDSSFCGTSCSVEDNTASDSSGASERGGECVGDLQEQHAGHHGHATVLGVARNRGEARDQSQDEADCPIPRTIRIFRAARNKIALPGVTGMRVSLERL